MNLDPALLEILVCPQCRATLFVDDDASELVRHLCAGLPVRRDIPVMLVDEARALR
ncbi:Trm112 family protein [Aeromicrobium sp. UC242_57]|uniref:Trm112 family protein n=1 Tax=Aeromicrobium sp. UC242_57 TaxID=3374624 RepID=UPI0037B7DFC7